MTFQRWLAGFVLLLLMLTFLFMNAVMFSARSFQHYVSQVAPETGGVIKLTEIERLGAEVKSLDASLAPLVGAATQADATVAELKSNLARARDGLSETQSQIVASVAALEAQAKVSPPATAPAGYDEVSLKARLEAVLASRSVTPTVRAAAAPIRTAITQAGDTEAGIAALTDRLAAAERAQLTAGEAVREARSQIVQRQSVYGSDFNRIVSEAEALKASSPFGITRAFAETHPTFLSTILVCVMGGLGAILYLFPLYMVPNAKVLVRDIIVRLVFGMATALAFYVVANATLAGFSLASPSEQVQSVGSNLNPFTVSLLGIIAGVSADDIAKWILSRGRELLGGGGGGGYAAPSEPPHSGMPDPNAAAPASAPPAAPGTLIDPNTGRPL